MKKVIGIDLGTANTLVYVQGKGIVLREPSVVAIDDRHNQVLAVGTEAKLMLGKTPGSITAFRPLKDGVIAEFDVTAAMLEKFFKKVAGNLFLNRPKVIVCIPFGVTEVEKRAVEDATLEAGAKSVALIEEPIAAAIGAGLKVSDARGSMIVDIGGGTTEVAVISLGGIVQSTSLRTAGDELDEAITAYIRRRHNILKGDTTAENLKKTIGSVHPSQTNSSMEIRGRNLISGLPSAVEVTSEEMREAMSEQIEHIIESIRNTLEETPPELSSDIYDDGIMLAGGGALLGGLDTLIHETTGVKVRISPRPLDSVAVGIGIVIESNEDLNELVSFRSR